VGPYGYDFIKVYNSIDAEEFAAIVEEAHLLGMAVIGQGVRAVSLPAPGEIVPARGPSAVIAPNPLSGRSR
jgi:hypothetical protein